MATTTLLSENAAKRIGERLYSLYSFEYEEDKDIKKLSALAMAKAYKEKTSKHISATEFDDYILALEDYESKKDPSLSKIVLNTLASQIDALCRLYGLNK